MCARKYLVIYENLKTVIVHMFLAYPVVLPQEEIREDIERNIVEAMALHLEVLADDGKRTNFTK